MIELRNVTKRYENATPLDNVSATINEGDVVAIIGPSGTGKSTFLRCINMLSEPTSGQVFIEGEEITAKNANIEMIRRKCGMIFQQFNLFGHLTVLQNVCEPQTHILKREPQEAYYIAMKYLKKVGMDKKIHNYPDMLSGGQKQRVAIARALAMDPKVILFDEPTSALDPTMVAEVEYIIRQLADEGRTMVIVTHEMEFAKHIANRVFYMDKGGIYEEGTVDEIFNNPQKELTRRFVKQLKSREIIIEDGDVNLAEILCEIYAFCRDCGVSRRMANRIQLFTEEMVLNTVFSLLQSGEKINIVLESEPSEESISVEVASDLITSVMLENMEKISRDLVKHSVKKLSIENGRIFAAF